MGLRGILLGALLCVPLLAAADTKVPLLAVLEFDAPDSSATPDELQLLTDAFRGAVVKEVGDRFKVMTRDTIQEMVPPEKMRCLAGLCAAEIGRRLQASHVMAGSVRKLGAKKVLTIEAYETNGGRVLGTEQFVESGVAELFNAVTIKSRGLVRGWLKVGASAAPVAEERVGGRSGDFDLGGEDELVASFESEPAGAVVLLDGKMLCSRTPCNKTIASGRHDVTMSIEQYEDAASVVTFTRSNKRAKLTLTPVFGLVTVETVPSGLPVLIDGKPAGSGPLSDIRLDPGSHLIVAVDDCHNETGERIVVAKGKSRLVKIEPPAKMAGIKVTAADDAGNDLEASVEVDGRSIGTTPLTAKVPACSKALVVRAASGRSWVRELSLREKELSKWQAVFAREQRWNSSDEVAGLGGHGGTGRSFTKITPGKTSIVGGLSADEVGRIVRRHWNEIKYCYEKELNKNPSLAGRVTVYFVIGPTGDVGEARVPETSLNNASAEECMIQNVRRWKFPPTRGGVVEVNYPFIFQGAQ